MFLVSTCTVKDVVMPSLSDYSAVVCLYTYIKDRYSTFRHRANKPAIIYYSVANSKFDITTIIATVQIENLCFHS